MKDFFGKEQMTKAGWAIIMVLAGFAVNGVLSSYTVREDSIKAGQQAKEQNDIVHPQVDSLKAVVIEERRTDEQEKRERAIRDAFMCQQVKDIKDKQVSMDSKLDRILMKNFK